jgi:hypothetical protein
MVILPIILRTIRSTSRTYKESAILSAKFKQHLEIADLSQINTSSIRITLLFVDAFQ